MSPPRRSWLALAAALGALAAFFVATAGPAPPAPAPPGSFSFAALGDAPYYAWEDLQYRLVLQAMDAHELAWVLHVGDILWRPCSDELYRRNLERFEGLRHPVVYTPGDNEWTDCWQRGSGAFAPLERLERLREVFFARPEESLTRKPGRRLEVVRQGEGDDFPELVENVRWRHRGLVFATVHLPGSRNALEPFPGRTPADDRAAERRTEGAAAWIRETFLEARETGASAVVVGFHGAPGLSIPRDDPYRRAYDPFLEVLEEEVARFGAPVLAVHGDDHEYTVDRPLTDRTTGRRLENFLRLQVPGSPDVGWVRVTVHPGAQPGAGPGAGPTFDFEPHVVPRWKYW